MSDNTLFINNKPDKYPIQFWLLMISCFINSMAQMITVFISLFLHKNNFSMGDIGIFISLFGIGRVIGGYVGGYISDYISPLKVTRYSSLLNAIAIMLFLLSTNYFYIGIILLIMGLANNLFRPASLLLILSFDKIGKPSIIISYRRVFVNLGTAIGVMVSGILFNYNPILVLYDKFPNISFFRSCSSDSRSNYNTYL
ncbi:MAG: MFS transporter [Proteobacteria bacterium]|nr:MFS transporter [Pseudomonadota bacterium]